MVLRISSIACPGCQEGSKYVTQISSRKGIWAVWARGESTGRGFNKNLGPVAQEVSW